MYLYTYYTKASLILTDVFICYVEIYIYFDGKHCICAVIDIIIKSIYMNMYIQIQIITEE